MLVTMAMPRRWLLVLILHYVFIIIGSYQYPSEASCSPAFWKRIEPIFAQKTNERLEHFARTAWHVHHGLSPPRKATLSKGQECTAPFPGLSTAQPFHSADEFCWSEKLTFNHAVVTNDLLTYLTETHKAHRQQDDGDGWMESTTNLCDDTRGYNKLVLLDTDGLPTEIGATYFASSLQLLKDSQVPLAPRPVCINCQHPETGLAPHSDNMNFLLTSHLGLIIPTDGPCTFRNHDETYSWETGSVVVADTSFVHATRNDSPTMSRYVLSFAIWHPDLSIQERQGILHIHDALQEEDV
jgi:aspartyl/asparaginyl beta-hydroxylase (cupin superfamily)